MTMCNYTVSQWHVVRSLRAAEKEKTEDKVGQNLIEDQEHICDRCT